MSRRKALGIYHHKQDNRKNPDDTFCSAAMCVYTAPPHKRLRFVTSWNPNTFRGELLWERLICELLNASIKQMSAVNPQFVNYLLVI